jgi:hypothetical protein
VNEPDLFPETISHDPGGKVRLRLLPGVNGDAVFAGNRHRPVLRRWIGSVFPDRYLLWIGMNPSTADAQVNDPTIGREWTFTRHWGFNGYVKCNISDYRSTSPKNLLALSPSEIQSAGNAQTILSIARSAETVIVCHGKLNAALAPLGEVLCQLLLAESIKLWCLGQNADGSPKHPLYVKGETNLVSFSPKIEV